MKHRINVSGDQTDTELRLMIRNAARRVLRGAVDMPCGIDVSVISDDEIRIINERTRGIDRATDVLSFPMEDWQRGERPDSDPETGIIFLGDIVISIDRVEAQAAEYGHGLSRELCYMTVHGCLHLLGYDHETEADKQYMREREEEILSSLGLSR